MLVEQKQFPKNIQERIVRDVRRDKINILFNNGADIIFSGSNIKITKAHNIVFMDKEKYLVAFIIENEIEDNVKPNIYINSISKHSKCSLTLLINTVNQKFFPSSIKRS